MKGVEHDLDRVVIAHVFASGFVCANLARMVEAYKNDVKVLLVIAEVGIGAL
jgi:hypothetical protein